MEEPLYSADFWSDLNAHTAARIALGRAGSSVPTKPLMDFRIAHARARDAVQKELDITTIERELAALNLSVLPLQSEVTTKKDFLLRPDLGRMLNTASLNTLRHYSDTFDISLVLADGLSAAALEKNSLPVLNILIPDLIGKQFSIAPVSLVRYGRVAIGDPIGAHFKSKLVIVFIGERPGLTSPHSMGIYLTWQPVSGTTDERRNCISNIYEGGLSYEIAADKLVYLITEACRKNLSGIHLKDDRLLY